MPHDRKAAMETAAVLRKMDTTQPAAGVLTGTGLGDCVQDLDVRRTVPYEELPHFSASTVESHPGKLLMGRIEGVPVMVLQGRFHLYEGYGPEAVVFPVRVLQMMGVKRLIVTNASGGLNPAFSPGDIMVIRDHINLTGANPLVGPNDEHLGARFPDMSRAYDRELSEAAFRVDSSGETLLRHGVYAGLQGPSLETPAEVRYLKAIGADAVGFSTVMEVIAAVHAGMRVLGLSTITNVHNPERPEPASLEEILKVARSAIPRLGRILREAILETP
jgi:purine-nucleoside phosphorylase